VSAASRTALVALSATEASPARDDRAREQALVLLTNLRTLASECESILLQAESFSSLATWLPDLGRTEWHLAHTTRAMADAAGLVAVG